MKRMTLLLLGVFFLTTASFAATMEDLQAFLRHQQEERVAFDKQQQQEREVFMKQNPDIAATLEQQRKDARARAEERAARGPMDLRTPGSSPAPSKADTSAKAGK